ncbi:hypothetical protein P7D31_09860 [Enterococcus dongliensis]|uniref:hypothetical protein n=1 Tax=Enterococcus dongliensis TaxID=2559925 RepID=UPI0028924BA2|nr:hypothetical protein [Enterococcus dongliensis]MDT2640420.1 hypothetical protein [Enterococcus dongliensis]
MKISIEATAQEIAELLRAITSNQEQNLNLSIDGGRVFPHKNQSKQPVSVEEKFANWDQYKDDYED